MKIDTIHESKCWKREGGKPLSIYKPYADGGMGKLEILKGQNEREREQNE